MSYAEKEASEIISKSYEHLSEPIGIIRPALMKNISDALKRRDEMIAKLETAVDGVLKVLVCESLGDNPKTLGWAVSDAIRSRDERIKELEVSVEGIQSGGRNIQREMVAKMNELETELKEAKERIAQLGISRYSLDQVHLEKNRKLESTLSENRKRLENSNKAHIKTLNKLKQYFELMPDIGADAVISEAEDSLTALDKPSDDK